MSANATTSQQQENLEIRLEGVVTLTPGGLIYAPGVSIGQWRHSVQVLKRFQDCFHCALADAIQYGRQNFSEDEVTETLEQLDFWSQDVIKAQRLAGVVHDLRDEFSDLTPGHFEAVAKWENLTPKKREETQRHWLKVARAKKYSAQDLKKAVERGKAADPDDIKKSSGRESGGIVSIEDIVQRFAIWERNVGGDEQVKKWPDAQKREFLAKTEEIQRVREVIKGSLSDDE